MNHSKKAADRERKANVPRSVTGNTSSSSDSSRDQSSNTSSTHGDGNAFFEFLRSASRDANGNFSALSSLTSALGFLVIPITNNLLDSLASRISSQAQQFSGAKGNSRNNVPRGKNVPHDPEAQMQQDQEDKQNEENFDLFDVDDSWTKTDSPSEDDEAASKSPANIIKQQPPSSSKNDIKVQNLEWLDGDVTLRFPQPYDEEALSHTGWATYTESTMLVKGVRIRKKKCFGCFQCTVDGCLYTIRPVRVNGQPKQEPGIRKKKSKICPIHGSECEIIRCECSIIYEFSKSEASIKHNGIHQHRRPPVFKPTKDSAAEFEKTVKIARTTQPKALVVGSSTRPPVSEIHESYQHLGRTAYHRRRVLEKFQLKNDMSAIASWHKQLDQKFIQKVYLDGDVNCMIVCTEFMRKWAKTEFEGWPMQTDSIHNVVRVKEGKAYLCTTTAYSNTLKRYTPIFATIMFNQTAEHFEKHFDFLFEILHIKVDEKNEIASFGGMTCDFSSSELKGYTLSFQKKFPQIDSSLFYQTCEVHFKRSIMRVQSNHAVIPPYMHDSFYKDSLQLLSFTNKEDFDNAVKSWKKMYPNAHAWLDWYLSPVRRSTVFKVFLSSDKPSNMSKDTNAQEGIGSDIKRCFPMIPSEIGLSLQSLYLYFVNIERDLKDVKSGSDIRYFVNNDPEKQKAKKKDQYVNDGRPPDTAEALGIVTKKRKANASPKVKQSRRKKTESIPSFSSSLCASEIESFLKSNSSSSDLKKMILEVDKIARNVPKYSAVKDYQVVLINSDECSNSEELFDSKVMIPHDSLKKMISELSNNGKSSTHCVSISISKSTRIRLCLKALLDIRRITFFLENRSRIAAAFQWVQETVLQSPVFSGFTNSFAKGIHPFFNETYDPLVVKDHIITFLKNFDPNATLFVASEFYTLNELDLLHLFNNNWINDNIVSSFFEKLTQNTEAYHTMNSFFLQSFGNSEFDSGIPDSVTTNRLNRLVKKFRDTIKKIPRKRTVFFPINIRNIHWVLAIVDMEEHKIIFYDSLGPDIFEETRQKILELLLLFLKHLKKGLSGKRYAYITLSSQTPTVVESSFVHSQKHILSSIMN
jgi:hypothetical protein